MGLCVQTGFLPLDAHLFARTATSPLGADLSASQVMMGDSSHKITQDMLQNPLIRISTK